MRRYILNLFFLISTSTAFSQQVLPPSPNENFVRVEQVRKTGITTEAQINALPIGRDKAVSYSYYDGLGRIVQANDVKGSPGAKDVLQIHTYDEYGRVAKSYLPYTITTNSGAIRTNGIVEQGAFYTAANDKIADDTRPFNETPFTSTVAESYAPGSAWHQNNRKTTQKLSFNTANSIRLWFIDSTTGLPKSTGTYPAGALTIEEVTDEENRVAKVYRDFSGKTVLKQEQDGISWQDSWYVYDDYDNLRYIVPPMVASTYAPSLASANLWFYQYEYDSEHRQIGYKAPGAGWIYTIYDKWDRPVLTQDANQRAKSPAEWSFVKYDDWNRPVLSGIMTSTETRATMTSSVAASGIRYEVRNTSGVGYSFNQTYPTTATEANLLSITYYDNYITRRVLPGH